MESLTIADFQSAIDAQSACNVSGLTHSLCDVIRRIWEVAHARHRGTDWVNQHPIVQLFSYQIVYLSTRHELFQWSGGWIDANNFCMDVINGVVAPDSDYLRK